MGEDICMCDVGEGEGVWAGRGCFGQVGVGGQEEPGQVRQGHGDTSKTTIRSQLKLSMYSCMKVKCGLLFRRSLVLSFHVSFSCGSLFLLCTANTTYQLTSSNMIITLVGKISTAVIMSYQCMCGGMINTSHT